MKRHFKYHWPAILWAMFIFVMCAIDLGDITAAPFFFPGFDKLAHCGFFFVLVVIYCNGLIRQQSYRAASYKALVIIILVAVVYGGLIELMQMSIFTWRTGEWGDLFSDTVGASMGAFSILLTVKAMNYVKK